jgi:hypothetical protein
MVKFQDALAYPPRMMNADRTAAYVDLSKTKFLDGVDSGTWPPAKDVGGMPRWDRLELDAANDTAQSRGHWLADTGTGIAAAEYIGQRRGQEEGNQNPGDEEIKEHGVVSLRSPIFKYEAEDR